MAGYAVRFLTKAKSTCTACHGRLGSRVKDGGWQVQMAYSHPETHEYLCNHCMVKKHPTLMAEYRLRGKNNKQLEIDR